LIGKICVNVVWCLQLINTDAGETRHKTSTSQSKMSSNRCI